MRQPVARLLLTLAIAALAPLTAHAEWPHDFRASVLVAPGSPGNQVVDAAVADGSGGAYVFFEDSRAGTLDVYGQHVRGDGTLDPAWPTTGLAICVAPGNQVSIKAIADSAGSIRVSWFDTRLPVTYNFATRVLVTGAIAPGFAANGEILGGGTFSQHPASIALDDAHGLIAVWEEDFTVADHDIRAVGWSPSGLLLWARGIALTGLKETNPAVAREPGAFDVIYTSGTSTIMLARFLVSTGVPVGTPFTASTQADVGIAPRIASDGAFGTDVAWVEKSGAVWMPVAGNYFAGTLLRNFGALGAGVTSPIALGDMVSAGNFQTWLAWGVFPSGPTYIQALMRFTASAPFSTGTIGVAAQPLMLAGDGSGGVLAAIGSLSLPDEILTATRRTADLATPALWAAAPTDEGVPAMMLIRNVQPGAMCSGGDAGALIFGYDALLSPSAVHGIRLDKWGAFDGAPRIVSVKDVANDQGGQVRVAWKASYLDRSLNPQVNSYWLWRQVPVAAAQALVKNGRPAYRSAARDAPASGTIRIEDSNAGVFAWELVSSQIANAFASYSLTVPTVADSGASGPANTVYMIEARSASLAVGWTSAPDSGRSVDNLPPATPAPFTAALVSGSATELTWGANSEPDLAGYQLYRAATAGFVPGPSNLIATTTSTSRLDVAVGQYYKLAAFDTHGNRSGFALVTPGGTLDAPGELLPRELALALVTANPATNGATLRYALPVDCQVRLHVFDVNGRMVRELFTGTQQSGSYTRPWDGRDANGALAPSGMYFARLQAGERRLVERIVLSH